MSDAMTVGVHGAAGRMGQRIVTVCYNDPEINLEYALESPVSPMIGKDAGEVAGLGQIGLKIDSQLNYGPNVIIDFSMPESSVALATICADKQIPLLVATTGFSDEQREQLLSVSKTIPLIIAPNTSMAVNLAMKLVGDAAKALKNLPDGVDVEIVERHHRFKEDAPSGTALKFGEIVANEMNQTEHVHGRHGRIGHRPQTEIGYHALRTGDNVGEHNIVFGMLGETLEVYVRGHTRDSYAYGAVTAAKFLAKQKPGLYTMADVMGF